MIVLNDAAVREALPMPEAILAMKEAFTALSSGQAAVPLRMVLPISDKEGHCLVMPAYASSEVNQALAVKVVCVFHNNPSHGLPTIQGAVLLFDPGTGKPIALIEGASLTAIRTGAASGLATDLLARSESQIVAIFGTGAQAQTQLEAICSVRCITKVWVCSRNSHETESVSRFIEQTAGIGPIPTDVQFASNHREALGKADIVCTATTSPQPVLDDADIRPGTHFNAIGSHRPSDQEIPPQTVIRSVVVVESRSAALAEAGDLLVPINEGLISANHIKAELGELILKTRIGRTSAEQITLFKSVGVSVQDAVAARVLYERALEGGVGQQIDW